MYAWIQQQGEAGLSEVAWCRQMQRARRRVAKRQRNEEPEQRVYMAAKMGYMAASTASLACQEDGYDLDDSSPEAVNVDRQGSDASTDTAGPMMLMPSPSHSINRSLRIICEQQPAVYIGNSHCPVDGWYQACRWVGLTESQHSTVLL